MSGLELPFDEYLQPAFVPGTTSSRYLVLVSSDTCPYSRAEVKHWRELLQRAPFRHNDEVVFISTLGNQIASELLPVLEQRHVHTQSLLVADKAAFVERTGIAWTPGTVVLDAAMRVRLAPERVTPAAQREITSFLSAVPQEVERR